MSDKKIQKKVQELKTLASKNRVDIHEDLNRIRAKLNGEEDHELSAWNRVGTGTASGSSQCSRIHRKNQ